MILLLSFAFLAGLVTILAPCIWPLLPIILSSAAMGKGHQKPLGITLGIMVSFTIFTLTISTLVKLFHFDPNTLRLVAVIVIGFLGVSLLIPQFGTLLETIISKLTSFFGQKQGKGNGFWTGFVTGLSLGIVWSPCAGPILAAIATLAATGRVTTDVVLITIAYVLGVGVPLFFFAYGGQQLITKTRFLSSQTGTVQKVFGIIMLLTALAIYTNYDTYIQAQLLQAFPQFNATIDTFEQNNAIKKQLDVLKGTQTFTTNSNLFNVTQEIQAPDFTGGTHWLNTKKPLSLADLKGKVVLVDFWTYTCINCLRTLPHVTQWYDTYKNNGFVVIGVHTPEFAFEHESTNVANAIKQYNIHYPVVQDNNYAIWNAYANQYWPAEYLIDANGVIRRVAFGEGEYDKTEQAIQALLQEAGHKVSNRLSTMPDTTPHGFLSPETYMGSARMQYYFPSGNTGNGTQTFTLSNPALNSFSLGGTWTIQDEEAITGTDAVLTYNFTANKVFLVLRPSITKPTQVRILLDGKVVDTTNAGQDVQKGIVTVDTDRLYNLIDLHGKQGAHFLRLEFLTPGTQIFAFTFG